MKTIFIIAIALAALLVIALLAFDILCPRLGEEEEDEHAQAARPSGPGLPHHRRF